MSGEPAPPAVETAGLGKTYGTFAALQDLTLRIAPGETYALLGPNGAGKTTTLLLLMGVLRPSAGQARIAGHDCFAGRADVMAVAGFTPDEPAFHDYLTGWELIRFAGTLHGLWDDRRHWAGTRLARGAPAAAEASFEHMTLLCRVLGLEDALGEYAMNYSRGMKKKLALTLALLHRPRVLVLDEPTNGLDPFATRTVHEIMQEYVANGATVLFSTHLLDQAERLAGRVGVLSGGKLVAEGTLAELRSRVAADASLESIFFAVDRGEGAPSEPAPP